MLLRVVLGTIQPARPQPFNTFTYFIGQHPIRVSQGTTNELHDFRCQFVSCPREVGVEQLVVNDTSPIEGDEMLPELDVRIVVPPAPGLLGTRNSSDS